MSDLMTLSLETGDVTIELMPDKAPNHVARIKELATDGFYDGLTLHRVIDGFMAQGGDPRGEGTGGPGYRYRGEFSPELRHDGPGILSMANAGPSTDGSQFFLTFKATPSLDDRHTIFGRVEDPDGLAVLERIEALGGNREPGTPSIPIVIERASILIE